MGPIPRGDVLVGDISGTMWREDHLSMMVMDIDPAVAWMHDTKSMVGSSLKRATMDIARDAALIARHKVPHNMTKDAHKIRWHWTAFGAAVVASGGPAAYDGGERFPTFRHPVFANPAKQPDRKTWRWTSQSTYPFIELVVHQFVESTDIDERIGKELQPIFDRP